MPEDVGAYDEEKRDIYRPPVDQGTYLMVKSKRERPIDTTGYDEGRNGYAVVKVKSKRERPIDSYGEDLGVYPEERKREANPAPLEKIEIDGDYPIPDDSSYPVKAKAKRMQKLDAGDYAPPDDVGAYGPEK